MADLVAPKSQPPQAKKRAVQRCPNCDIRCDVSLFVDGSLARCGHCGVRFEVQRPKSTPAATVQPQTKAPEPPFPQLEGFLVHERIGQGGMGEVFRCTRISDQVPVAVKILTPQMAAVPDYVRRFGREAAAMAQLEHPGIVRLLGRGKAGQHVYIAMELIEGESLRMWAHRNRPPAQKLAALLAQVAHALAYAHARAVVHRDLKPDNVLVTNELRTGELPVGKFALPSKLVPGLDARWDPLVERCLESNPGARPHSALELSHALEALGGVARTLQVAPRSEER